MKFYLRRIMTLLLVLVLSMGTSAPSLAKADEGATLSGVASAVERLSGSNRVDTAIAVSKKAYAGQVDTLFLAGYNGDADALTATFMTGKLNGPMLLSDKSKLSSNLLSEIKRLNPNEIILLGGENAISKSIENELKSRNFNTRRIQGQSRIETAVNVALDYYKKTTVPEVFVVEYSSLVDALAIGPVAAKTGSPVLITRKNEVPDEVKEALKTLNVQKVTIVGGENTVSKRGKAELEKLVGQVERVYGKDRMETSLNIAKKYFPSSSTVFLANGFKNADALIGGYFAGMKNSPILLTHENNVIDPTLNFLSLKPKKAYLLGGESVLTPMVHLLAEWALAGLNGPKPGTSDIEYLASVEQEVFRLVNEYRGKNGLHAYKTNSLLDQSARYKSHSMIEHNYFAHENPQLGGGGISEVMWKKYSVPFSRIGENIACTMGYGKASAEKIFTMWKTSPGHNAAMLSPKFTHMGVGVTYSPKGGSQFSNMNTTTATQHFGG